MSRKFVEGTGGGLQRSAGESNFDWVAESMRPSLDYRLTQHARQYQPAVAQVGTALSFLYRLIWGGPELFCVRCVQGGQGNSGRTIWDTSAWGDLSPDVPGTVVRAHPGPVVGDGLPDRSG
jgi:hypothetical protein